VGAFAGPRAEVAVACSCGGVDPARDVPRFDAAFVGTATSRRVDGVVALWGFDVERAVKGRLPARIVVSSAADGAACGLELSAGTRTGLLLDYDGAEYRSSLCYQTDPDELARYVLPTASVFGRPTGGAGWPWWTIAAGVGGLAAIAFGALALRRRT
jgi:hypothetical protein